MPHFIEFHDVCKFYTMGENRIAAADHISFYVDQGEFCIIVGPSGAGKTTVLNMLGGMDSCDEGEILLDGSKISEYNAKQLTTYRRYDVGFVFQFYNLVQNLTALENVELASEICKDPLDAKETLLEVGLGERLNNFPAQLSGGERQRLGLARAFLHQGDFLLLDEPTSNLDSLNEAVILRSLGEERGEKTVLLVSHRKSTMRVADTVYNMDNGRMS